MRNLLKATTLESRFPLLAVEHDCIISKDADVTAAFEVTLPELYTVTSEEYEAIHSAWCKAIKVLPDFSIVHKQDWFVRETYKPELQKEEMSFLSRSFERHFNERPYLHHTCYLYLTKTTRERSRRQSNFSTLCRGFIIPREIDRESTGRFIEAVEQFARIMNDCGFIRLRRLTGDEITGTVERAGLIEKYFSLSTEENTCLQDIALSAEEMRIGNKRLCLHTLSHTEDLPVGVATDTRYEKLSTERSDCRLSFASPVGLLLDCNHIYNQYVFIDNSDENLRRFEKSARNMQSLSRYSRSNAINQEWTDEYLNEAHSCGLVSVRAHFSVMSWSNDSEELKRIKNDTGSQLAMMGCMPRHNTIDCPTLYWAGIPGNAGGLPERRELLYLHRAGSLPVHRGNELPELPFPFRDKDGGPADGTTAAPGHIGPAYEAWRDNEPQQVRTGPFGQREVVLHEPPHPAILRAGQPYRADRHGQLVPGVVRADTPQDKGRRRDILYIFGREADFVQSLLYR